MLANDGEWLSRMADRLPSQLDDAIKGVRAEFYMAAKDLTPEELKDELPMAFPTTHTVKGFPCIAKYRRMGSS
eukprot:3203269-Lingulodinium_polyedra.AAC.1